MEETQQNQHPTFSLAKLGYLSTAIAQSAEIWLHYGRDDGSLASSGLFGLLFLLIFQFSMVIFLPNDNHWPLLLYAAATTILYTTHRLSCFIGKHLDRPRCRGRYTGRPLLSHVLAFDEAVIKSLEPLLVIAAGAGVYRFSNRPLGLYLSLAGMMLLIYVCRGHLRAWRDRRTSQHE